MSESPRRNRPGGRSQESESGDPDDQPQESATIDAGDDDEADSVADEARSDEGDEGEDDGLAPERVASRATLRAEERHAGSDDPREQAASILAEAEQRRRRSASHSDPDTPTD